MKVKIKRSGIIFTVVTILLGVAAANTGNNLLYIVVSSMLSTMLMSGIFSILNLKGIKVVLLPPAEIYARRKIAFRLLLEKEGLFPSFMLRVSSSIDEVFFLIVDKRGAEGTINFVFANRGIVEEVCLFISSEFPLNLFVRSFEMKVKVNITVFPEPLKTPLPIEMSNYEKEGGMPYKSTVKGYEELKDIREYNGEPLKLVHWKLSAKKGSLMVKEMVMEEKNPVVLDLDKVEGNTEEKLSKLTYLIIELLDMGYAVGLVLREKEIPPDRGNLHKLRMLRELALY